MKSPINDEEIYSDIISNYNMHPIKKDLVRLVNEAAVKTAIKNLLYTNKTERFFQPTVGANLRKHLFENMTPITANAIKEDIEETISNFEPRCRLIDVQVIPLYEQDSYSVTILFYLINTVDPVSMSLTLGRDSI